MINTIETYCSWFIVYSIIGWLYESILCSFIEKKFVNRGFLNGPYCPIYGFGALLDIIFLSRFENVIVLFFFGIILNCSLEYLTSFLMEKLFGARWWDYSDKKFNINGRVCLLGAVVFGTFSVVLIKIVHPFVIWYMNMIPGILLHIIVVVFLIAFVYDNLLNEFESYQNKISRRTTFIFVLILILIISILITIYGNYNRDIQLLQEINRLEQKIEFLEEEKSEEQNILEFM